MKAASMAVLALISISSAVAQSTSVSAQMKGPSYFNERTTPFNVTLGFSAPVSGIDYSSFRLYGANLVQLITLSKQIYKLTVTPGTNRDGSISTYMQVSLLQNSADQGNGPAFYTSQYSEDADKPGTVNLGAPSYYTTGQTRLLVQTTFSRGPLKLENYRFLQEDQVTVSGGASLEAVQATCPFRSEGPLGGAGGDAAEPAVLPAVLPASDEGVSMVADEEAASGARRAQIFPGFGPCLLYTLVLKVKGGPNRDDISIMVKKDALGTDSNAMAQATIQFDQGGRIDGANLTYNGRTTYGPNDQAVFGSVTITPYVDPENITSDILNIQSPDVVLANFQAFGGGGFGSQTPSTSIRFTLYPTVEENFTISIAEDALPQPGNKPLSQTIRFTGSSSGGGTRPARPITFTMSGQSQFDEETAANVPFSLQVFISDSLKQSIGDLTQLVSARNFQVTGGGFIKREWASSWPAAYYDDRTTTFFFNVTVPADRSGVYPSPIRVSLLSFPNATIDSRRPPQRSAYFSSVLPRVQVGVEAPAYYTVANDSQNVPQPQPLYINVHLDTPVDNPRQFTPGMLQLTGCVLTGNTTKTAWSFTNNAQEFLALVLPQVDEDGSFQDISIRVNYNSLGFTQGNNGATAQLSYEPGVANAEPATTSVEVPSVHNGQDPFVVTVSFDQRVHAPRSAGGTNLGYWLSNRLTVLNGYAQVFPDPSYVQFPTTEIQFRVTPRSEASVYLYFPSNVVALPGNTFSRVRIPYGAGTSAPALASIYGDVVHQGPTGRGSEFDGILVTIQFSQEMPGIENLRYWQVVRVYGGTVQNSQYSTPFSSSSTTYAQLQVVPDGQEDVVIQIPENVLGDDGVQNLASTKTITYTPAPALVILSGPQTHQGPSSLVRVVASFDRPVTGVSESCLGDLNQRATVSSVSKEDDEGREWSFDLSVATEEELDLQVGGTCVSSAAGNYASRVLTVGYTPPAPPGAPATVSIVAPVLHDASESIEVVFQWNKNVKGFSAEDVVVSPMGVMKIGGLTPDASGAVYNLRMWFAKPMDVSSQVTLNVTVKQSSVETGNEVRSAFIQWDQYGPAPSPAPSPAPACQEVTCSGHGQCEAVAREGPGMGSGMAPRCDCETGYGGFACSYVIKTPACANRIKDEGESDVDCGGPCRPCAEGLMCTQPSDCDFGSDCYTMPADNGTRRERGTYTVGRALAARKLRSTSSSLGMDTGMGVCQSYAIGNVTKEVVKVTWAFRGLRLADVSSRVTAALRHRIQRYVNKGTGGSLVPSVLLRLSEILVTRVSSWMAPASNQLEGRERSLMATNQSDGVTIALQIGINSTADAPSVVGALRNALASGIVATNLMGDLPGVPLASVEDPGDGSGAPSVGAPVPAPSSLPPIPSPGPSGGGKKKNDVGIEVAAGVAAGALVLGLVAGALVMYCRQKSDSERLAERQAAETTGQQYRTAIHVGEDGRGRVVREPVARGDSTRNPLDANAAGDTGAYDTGAVAAQ